MFVVLQEALPVLIEAVIISVLYCEIFAVILVQAGLEELEMLLAHERGKFLQQVALELGLGVLRLLAHRPVMFGTVILHAFEAIVSLLHL